MGFLFAMLFSKKKSVGYLSMHLLSERGLQGRSNGHTVHVIVLEDLSSYVGKQLSKECDFLFCGVGFCWFSTWECMTVRRYALSLMVLALFQTISESFWDFYNICMYSESSFLSFFLVCTNCCRIIKGWRRVMESEPAFLSFLGIGSEQVCRKPIDRRGQTAMDTTVSLWCCRVQVLCLKTEFFIWIVRLLGTCQDMCMAQRDLGEME